MGMFGDLTSFDPISAGINALTSAWQVDRAGAMADHAQEMSAAEAATTRDWSTGQAATARDWEERMSGTAYQRQVKDMEAAGLNPMLAAMKGGGASTPSAPMPSGATGQGFMAHVDTPDILRNATTAAQVENINASTEKLKAETDSVRSTTPVTIDKMRQDISESSARIDALAQSVKTGIATADNLAQQTENLRETVPHIRASVEQLVAFTKQTGALTGKTEAETAEIRQRVAAGLPALQGALANIEGKLKLAHLPQAQQDAQVHASEVGSLAAVLRAMKNAISPFSQ